VNRSPNSLRSTLKEQTRAAIVAAAFDLFGKFGFEKVSVEMIAAAAGISRATFFNYFPQKDLILREIASARAEKLKTLLAGFGAPEQTPTLGKILDLVLNLTEENARISRQSKKLLLETVFRQASQGLLLIARDQAVEALAAAIERIPRRDGKPARQLAETLFAVYMGTMMEWLMREGVPHEWLVDTMRERLVLVLEGVA
jgi:AcrR family transcriptional regulator